jgi:hypothetical protein
MLERRFLFGLAIGATVGPVVANAQSGPSAAERMNELGAENQALVSRIGKWDVIETNWNAPGADPVVSTGLVAERQMVGSMLQEIIRRASDANGASIKRLDYLTFNRVEGRWQYVSMDTRSPVGIMPAWSFDRSYHAGIVLEFAPFAVAGSGLDVTGRLLRMDRVITQQGLDQDRKDQHFVLADGTGTKWLAHRYAYVRRT